MLGWQKIVDQIQKLKNLWYTKPREASAKMPTQKAILSFCLGNKEKKKVMSEIAKSCK